MEPQETTHLEAKRGLQFNPKTLEVEITIATNAGACFGVVRAIKLGLQASKKGLKTGKPVYSLGALIHNPHVVKELESNGVKTVDAADALNPGTVILRSHGIRKEIEAKLRAEKMEVVDATCPLVKKPQRIAQSIGEKGHFLVIVGDAKHPEIQGVLSYYGKPTYLVTYRPEDIATIPNDVTGVGILAQTTVEVKVFDAIVKAAQERFQEVESFNTICDATSIRQTEAVELAKNADVLVVVGGKSSSNTNKLVKICKELQPETFHIEEIAEIQANWFKDKRKIGITAGASTPHEYVDAVGEHIVQLVSELHQWNH